MARGRGYCNREEGQRALRSCALVLVEMFGETMLNFRTTTDMYVGISESAGCLEAAAPIILSSFVASSVTENGQHTLLAPRGAAC
eukprot:scaffold10729_cov91-Skeletonema_dohrnii-CCMP3373.AAC.10